MRLPNPWKGIGAQPREIWALCGATLVNRVGTMIVPFLVLYLTESRHFSESAAGRVLALYGLGALIASPIAGALSDRLGPLRVLIGALAGAGLIALAIPLVPGFAPVVIGAFSYALVAELVRPASLTIVSSYSDPDRRKGAFALLRLVVNLGMSIGPALGGFLSAISFPLLFWVDGATSLAAAAVLFAVTGAARRARPPAQSALDALKGPRLSTRGLRDRRLLHALVAIIPAGIVFFQFESALPLYLVHQAHYSERLYGLLFTANTLIIVAVEVPLNLAMARWPHRPTLAAGCVLVALGYGVLALPPSTPVILLSVLGWTFGEMVLFPGLSSYVADISPDDRRGEYMGLYSMSFGVCFAAGPWLGTLVLERFGAPTLWLSCGVIGLAAAMMMSALPEKSASAA